MNTKGKLFWVTLWWINFPFAGWGGVGGVGGLLARVITFSIACGLCTSLFLCKCHQMSLSASSFLNMRISKYCDRTPFTSKVEENISPAICVHCVLITENCPSVN